MLVAMVDESCDVLDMLATALELAGYAVASVQDMEETCARLRAIGPDAILLSMWTYPRERGWQILLDLTVDPALCAVPVIVYSSDRRDLEDHAELLASGGCQALLAPFHLADLYGALRRVTAAARGTATLA